VAAISYCAGRAQVQTFFGRPFFRFEAILKMKEERSLAITKRSAF
jgi:hypothetical protein